MEDVFKALYNPELEIDRETKKLLYASYDCLRIPLTAEFSQAPIDRDEILDRAAVIFAQLQEIFGDYLQGQDAFPTSEELGLDVFLRQLYQREFKNWLRSYRREITILLLKYCVLRQKFFWV